MLLVLTGLAPVGSCDSKSTIVFSTNGSWIVQTHNRLANTSIPLVTAVLKRIIMQMLVKLKSRQNELGMSAGRLCLT